jgi:hypothetical protein
MRLSLAWISGLTIMVGLSFGLAAWSINASVDTARKQRHTLCIVQRNSDYALRDVLVLAESFSTKGQHGKRLADTQAFYISALKLVQPTSC